MVRRSDLLGSLFLVSPESGPRSPISAVSWPLLDPLEDEDQISILPSDWDQTSNYTSTAGTIVSAVGTITLNGDAASLGDPVEGGDLVESEVLVTDSESNTRRFRSVRAVALSIPEDAITLDGTAETVVTLDGTKDTIIVLGEAA